jgi:hypothetical protein
MSMQSKKSLGWTFLLIILGLASMAGGVKTLILMLPAAWFIWREARSITPSSRNQDSRN